MIQASLACEIWERALSIKIKLNALESQLILYGLSQIRHILINVTLDSQILVIYDLLLWSPCNSIMMHGNSNSF